MGNIVLIVTDKADDDVINVIENVVEAHSVMIIVNTGCALRRALEIWKTLRLIVIVAQGPEDEDACQMLTMFKLSTELTQVPTVFYSSDSEEDWSRCPKCGQMTMDDDDDIGVSPSPPKPN
ncbi:MAG: hypothetical protein ACM3NH_02950 [Candidatus Saccharibacteria bacterium]